MSADRIQCMTSRATRGRSTAIEDARLLRDYELKTTLGLRTSPMHASRIVKRPRRANLSKGGRASFSSHVSRSFCRARQVFDTEVQRAEINMAGQEARDVRMLLLKTHIVGLSSHRRWNPSTSKRIAPRFRLKSPGQPSGISSQRSTPRGCIGSCPCNRSRRRISRLCSTQC